MIYFGSNTGTVSSINDTITTSKSPLENACAYGVLWAKNQSSPTCTRIGNLDLHRSLPIQSQYKGCVVDIETKQVKYWLKEDNWNYKADGTPSVLDGTDGDVMVHIPRFYGKSVISGDTYQVWICPFDIDGTWDIIPECYVSAYHICTNRSGTLKARSIVNTTTEYRGGNNNGSYDTYLSTDPYRTLLGKPRTLTSLYNMETYCTNHNKDFHVLSYHLYKWIFYWSWVIEYATFHSQLAFNSSLTTDGFHQGGLGAGVVNWSANVWDNFNGLFPIIPCGFGNSLGNGTGVIAPSYQGTYKSSSATAETETYVDISTYNSNKVPRWRGFDNPFGDISTNLQGIVVTTDNISGSLMPVYIQKDPNKYYYNAGTSTANTPSDINGYLEAGYTLAGNRLVTNGYIGEWNLGHTSGLGFAEILCVTNAGTTSTYKTDYMYGLNTSYKYFLRSFLVGGYANYGGSAGLGYSNSLSPVSRSGTLVGFRAVLIA